MVVRKGGDNQPPLTRAHTMPEVELHEPPASTHHTGIRNRGRRQAHKLPPVIAPSNSHKSSGQLPTSAQQTPNGAIDKTPGAPRIPVSQEHGNWAQVAEDLEDHDERTVKKWNEQIDTLLVFAGLFSAVVTAFNIEAYHQLKLDANEASKSLLITISQQLSELPRAMQSGAVSNATAEVLNGLDSFQPSDADVWINVLWFSSLVCSLIAASLGILIKQWLQRYKTEDYSLARERTRIRQHRFAGLLRWNIPNIISFLPLLLRTSLNLFFVGLIVFLRTLYWPVAVVISLLIGLWFFAYFGSLVLPALFADCPYKSPEAMLFYLLRRCKEDGFGVTLEHLSFISWSDAEQFIKTKIALDVETLVTIDQTFSDRGLQGMVRGCLKDIETDDVILCIRRIISHRLHTRVGIVAKWWALNTSRITKRCAETLIHILLDTVERIEGQLSTLKDASHKVEWFNDAIECVVYLLNCMGGELETSSLDDRLLDILPNLVEAAWSWQGVPSLVQSGVVAVICSRPSLCQAPLAPVLPKLLLTATSILTDSGDEQAFHPIRLCRVMLSLISITDLDTIDRATLAQFFTVCENAIDAMAPMSMTTAKASDDFISEVNRCMDKLHDLEVKFCDIPNIPRMQTVMTVKLAQAYVASATSRLQGSRI